MQNPRVGVGGDHQLSQHRKPHHLRQETEVEEREDPRTISCDVLLDECLRSKIGTESTWDFGGRKTVVETKKLEVWAPASLAKGASEENTKIRRVAGRGSQR